MPKVRPVKPNKSVGRRGGGGAGKENEKMTKEEKAVLKYLYNNVENKKATMYGNHKQYFCGAKAVSCLMESKFASSDSKHCIFNNKKMVIEFCQKLISKDAFHHVVKIVKRQKPRVKEPSKDDSSSKKTAAAAKSSKKGSNESSSVGGGARIDTNAKDDKDATGADDAVPGGSLPGTPKSVGLHRRKIHKGGAAEEDKNKRKDTAVEDDKSNSNIKSKSSGSKGAGGDSKSNLETTQPRKKVKGKVLLELDHDQTFYDDAKAYYVWVYECNSLWKSLIGGGLIIGCIALCLFPLWPDWLRHGAWYASSSIAMGLLIVLLSLALVRLLVYGVVFCATVGKCRFWLLPNLFAEVGFFESFVPYYESKWVKQAKDASNKCKKKSKLKDSDEEDVDEKQGVSSECDDESNAEIDGERDQKKEDIIEPQKTTTSLDEDAVSSNYSDENEQKPYEQNSTSKHIQSLSNQSKDNNTCISSANTSNEENENDGDFELVEALPAS